jgi:hypothetical protein
MRLVPAVSLFILLALGCAAGCSAADDSDLPPAEPAAQDQADMKACPYMVPVCEAPCKLVGHCPQKCQCPQGGTVCGSTVCYGNQTCCSGMPFPEPTCINGDVCPISRAKYKTEIEYLSQSDDQKLHDQLLDMPLASYRYKTEEPGSHHLGFIIDDVGKSPAVDSAGEHVDLYGYTTMAVATLKVQSRQIAELQREVADLRREAAACKH